MPGLAFGTAIFMAAGTAIYDALAANTEKINLFPISCVIMLVMKAIRQPFNNGTIKAKMAVNEPF